MEYNARELIELPFLNAKEAAFLLRLKVNTIRRWVSINGKTGLPYNPLFPSPVYRGKLTFRTSDVLAYSDDRDNTTTLLSPYTNDATRAHHKA